MKQTGHKIALKARVVLDPSGYLSYLRSSVKRALYASNAVIFLLQDDKQQQQLNSIHTSAYSDSIRFSALSSSYQSFGLHQLVALFHLCRIPNQCCLKESIHNLTRLLQHENKHLGVFWLFVSAQHPSWCDSEASVCDRRNSECSYPCQVLCFENSYRIAVIIPCG